MSLVVIVSEDRVRRGIDKHKVVIGPALDLEQTSGTQANPHILHSPSISPIHITYSYTTLIAQI